MSNKIRRRNAVDNAKTARRRAIELQFKNGKPGMRGLRPMELEPMVPAFVDHQGRRHVVIEVVR